MNIHSIRTKQDYEQALREVSAYFNDEPDPRTPEGNRFEILVTLLEAYEAKHFPVDPTRSLYAALRAPPRILRDSST